MVNKNVFISHCWDYTDDYEKIKEWVDNIPRYNISDYSISAEKKLNLTGQALANAIADRISHCSVFIVPTAIYSSYSDWVNFEIRTAVSMKKPILGVNPWAQQHYSQIVTTYADKIVGWQEKSVQDGVRALVR